MSAFVCISNNVMVINPVHGVPLANTKELGAKVSMVPFSPITVDSEPEVIVNVWGADFLLSMNEKILLNVPCGKSGSSSTAHALNNKKGNANSSNKGNFFIMINFKNELKIFQNVVRLIGKNVSSWHSRFATMIRLVCSVYQIYSFFLFQKLGLINFFGVIINTEYKSSG